MPLPPSILLNAFDLPNHRYVFLIGGGGKTTLMFEAARALADTGRTVITTTSTKINHPTPARSPHVLIQPDVDALLRDLPPRLAADRHLTLAPALLPAENKLTGFPVAELDRLHDAQIGGSLVAGGATTPPAKGGPGGVLRPLEVSPTAGQPPLADHILVEADGSAGRPLKAHFPHEPVISPRADLVIAVIGTDCLGQLLNDQHVHRAARFAELLNHPLDAPVTMSDVAAICFHPEGYLHKVPSQARLVVFLRTPAAAGGASDSPPAKGGLGGVLRPRDDAPIATQATALAAALRAADHASRIHRIVIGNLLGPKPSLTVCAHNPPEPAT